MKLAPTSLSGQRVASLLKGLRARGVRIWEEDGRLRYTARKGVITAGDVDALKLSRREIIAALRHSVRTGEDLVEVDVWQAPLTYTQFARWNTFDLAHRRSLRQVVSAIHLRGHLNCCALRDAIAAIGAHHDALRTRITIHNGMPEQQVCAANTLVLKERDIKRYGDDEQADLCEEIERCVLETVSVLDDPLACVQLLKVADGEHILVVAMEHLIADAVSMNILLRDLFTAYRQFDKNERVSLPVIDLQFWAYATTQRASEQQWLQSHQGYWAEHFRGLTSVHFSRRHCQERSVRGWGTVSVHLDVALVVAFRSLCALHRTTLSLGIFSLFSALALRWCGLHIGVLQFQSDGRFSTQVNNTIGFFATALYLQVRLHDSDSVGDLLDRVTREYCAAYEHADSSYFEARQPRPSFTDAVCFNWLPRDTGFESRSISSSGGELQCQAIPVLERWLGGLRVDGEPTLLLHETADGVFGGIHFPLHQFESDAIQKFGATFERWVCSCARAPDQRISQMELAV